MTDSKFTAILSGPIVPTLVRLTLPVIGVIGAQTAVALLEAYWVSHLGTDAIAGVSLVLPLLVLMGTMSNGGIGGGVSSAVSRALGAGRVSDANALLVHAIIIACLFGGAFTVGFVAFGRAIYTGLGGVGASLENALVFSAWVFGGAIVIWVFNLMGSALRGAGDVKLPAVISLIGAAVLIPVSPVLIFGLGPIPALGLSGAGLATVGYYVGALVVLTRHLLRGDGPLKLTATAIELRHFIEILRVGLVSAAGTLIASITAVALIGIVGQAGPEVLAGYGIASRLESLLVPILFGLGTGVITMIGAATGAGDIARARRVAWLAAGLAFVVTEAIGLLVAFAPELWMGVLSDDRTVRATGSTYLRVVGPFSAFSALDCCSTSQHRAGGAYCHRSLPVSFASPSPSEALRCWRISASACRQPSWPLRPGCCCSGSLPRCGTDRSAARMSDSSGRTM
jgi:putative MATE family efflux protein